ncbi:S41 family peptidase [Paenibacillus oceani]|uniref:S41 family peptidase n=1 Tax=Paenibacillus oceani TaxID=2772510 RepID=A0A927H427_9BACL|nr:S41 family peptidase [Paenibacillus oceani]MBD2866927.1 S41 family peptidase [Paenibacillus oceani]
MERQTQEETIHSLSTLLIQNYVFPDMAHRMQVEFTQRLNDNEYSVMTDPATFAKTLTSQLQNTSKDKHLNVRYNPQKPPTEDHAEGKDAVLADHFMTMIQLDNYGFAKIERLQGNIGLLEFHAFMSPEHAAETASSAMTFLANTSCLIIDIRKNFGGDPHMVAFLTTYLLDPAPKHLNSFYLRKNEEIKQFWTMPYVPGKKFGGSKPLYILTSNRTFSAAEEFAYNLQTMGRAIIVGERTGGGAHPGGFHRINKDFEVFIPSGRAINPITQTNWEGVGITPDIEVPQDQAFEVAYSTLLQSEHKRISENPIPGGKRLMDELERANRGNTNAASIVG